VGAEIAAKGKAGVELTEELLGHSNAYCVRVGVMALATRASDPNDRTRGFERLHDRADEPTKEQREAVIDALAAVAVARGDDVVEEFRALTDGFLHAHVALAALTKRPALDRLTRAGPLLDRITEAFDLADQSSRAAERAQGVRLLRERLPEQIAAVAARFPEALAWIEERLSVERPETRDVLQRTIDALRGGVLGDAEVARLRRVFESHAKKPRDPSRIVQGTRRRGKL
jgi:hypothetical protein